MNHNVNFENTIESKVGKVWIAAPKGEWNPGDIKNIQNI